MTEILLDPKISLKSRPGFTIISSEIEFLNHFDKQSNLLIQGERLCRWAETFYFGRKREVSTYSPFYEELTRVVPFLTESDALKIEKEFQERDIVLDYPLSVNKLLHSRFPNKIWNSRPSWAHGAEWLAWLVTEKPENHYLALITSQLNSWITDAEDKLKMLYHVTNSEEAVEVLKGWLCIEQNQWSALEEKYPILVPEELFQIAREKWMPEIISSEGQFFSELDVNRIPFSLLRLAAKETYNYLRKHPGKIIETHYAQLAEYIDPVESEWLSRNQKPKIPGELPRTPEKVIKWFIEEYLPFREWQHITQSKDEKPLVLDYAKKFALWYLEEYPKGILDGPISEYISFRRVRGLIPKSDELLIIIVMDGLHCIDARTLKQLLLPKIPECQIMQSDYVFSAIPTITEDSKEALLRAVPPENIKDAEFDGEVISRNKSLSDHIRDVKPPRKLFWRLTEPDSTYHRINKFETLKHDVKGSLMAATEKIQEIIEALPDDVQYRLIITSDHGRMLGESNCIIPIPEGFEGHGRVAKGNLDLAFPASGVIVEDNITYLSKERFGTKRDLMIPLGDDSFLVEQKPKNRELYPHGGLFPEEVIIPWFIFMKPEIRPEVSIQLTGKGQSRKKAIARIIIINSSKTPMILEKIHIDYHAIAPIHKEFNSEIAPLSKKEIELEFLSWPSQNDKREMLAEATLRSLNGVSHLYEIEKNFQSEDLYSSTDILEELP